MNVTPFRFDFFNNARPNPFAGSGARQSKAIALQAIVTSIISGQFPAQWWHYYARWWFFFGMLFCVVVVVEWKKDGFFCIQWYRAGGRFCFTPTRIFLFVIYFRRNLYLRFSFSQHSKLFIILASTSPFSIVENTLRHNWYDRGFFFLGWEVSSEHTILLWWQIKKNNSPQKQDIQFSTPKNKPKVFRQHHVEH